MTATQTVDTIRKEIMKAAGMDSQGRIDGHYVYLTITEMRRHIGSYRTEPSGQFQIQVAVPNQIKKATFRTKKATGEYDINGIVKVINEGVATRNRVANLEELRAENEPAAARLRAAKIVPEYISAYAGSVGTYVSASTIPGKLSVQVNFGNVSPEVAEQILKFAASITK